MHFPACMRQHIPECCRLVMEKLPYFSDQGGRDHIFLWSSEIFDPQAASTVRLGWTCPMAQAFQIMQYLAGLAMIIFLKT